MTEKKNYVKRRQLRFNPDENNIIEVAYDESMIDKPVKGLLYDESFSGCSGIFHNNEKFLVGQSLTVKVGRLHWLNAEVRYMEAIYEKLIKVGFEILD